MKNAECTPLTPEEEKELFSAFPRYLSDDEEALARKFFPQYVFFEAVGKNVRWCVCTSCMEGFTVDKEIRPDFFKIKHKGVCECPNCGQRAELLAKGVFFISTRQRDSVTGTMEIHGFDAMRRAGETWNIDPYANWPMPEREAVEDIAERMGVELDTPGPCCPGSSLWTTPWTRTATWPCRISWRAWRCASAAAG